MKLAAQSITELCSGIVCDATQELLDSGVTCDLAEPRVIKGTRVRLRAPEKTGIVIPFTITQGELCATIALKEAA